MTNKRSDENTKAYMHIYLRAGVTHGRASSEMAYLNADVAYSIIKRASSCDKTTLLLSANALKRMNLSLSGSLGPGDSVSSPISIAVVVGRSCLGGETLGNDSYLRSTLGRDEGGMTLDEDTGCGTSEIRLCVSRCSAVTSYL